jgi:dephospho-CoA kinase
MSAAYVVGLTGGIGSGKSAVADAFSTLGIEIVDTDLLAHRLSAAGQPGFAAIRAAFPGLRLLPDGEIDRAALRQMVFEEPATRTRLEHALHPLIGAEAKREIGAWKGAYGVVVVPLLLEREGLRSVVDRVLVVDCPEDEQVRRVTARSGLAPAEVRAIMAAQLPRARRLAAADDVVDNAGGPEAIEPQVRGLDRRYRELAAARCAT